jgi:fatty-acyl-CoA synthase
MSSVGRPASCRGQVAGYKRPCGWRFVDEMPKNVSGRVLKRELRAQWSGDGKA